MKNVFSKAVRAAGLLTGISSSGAIVICMICNSMFAESGYAQCGPERVAELLASDGAMSDHLGVSVAIDGDRIIVGAFDEDARGVDSGSAYIYRLVQGEWLEEVKLVASDGASGDHFGTRVSISGDRVLITAPHDDDHGSNSGSAYVYRFDGSQWIEEAKLLASDGYKSDYFGNAVEIRGHVAIVGAPGEDSLDTSAGAAYIFRFDGSEWVEESKVTASDGGWLHYFGGAVSIEGATALIGARRNNAAYIFEYDGSNWLEQIKLVPADVEDDDNFGVSVSLSGNAAIIGADRSKDFGDDSGAAYIFRFDGANWVEEAKLLASGGKPRDVFGKSVSLSDETAIIGTYILGSVSESAYIFRFDGSQWVEEDRLLDPDGPRIDAFGYHVAVGGDTAVVGVPADHTNGYQAGAAHVFDLNSDVPRLKLSVDNLVAGEEAMFRLTNGTPGKRAVTVYGLHKGQSVIWELSGYCALFDLEELTRRSVLGRQDWVFDANGEIVFEVGVPAYLSGKRLYFQSAQRDTCPAECTSEVVAETVQ